MGEEEQMGLTSFMGVEAEDLAGRSILLPVESQHSHVVLRESEEHADLGLSDIDRQHYLP